MFEITKLSKSYVQTVVVLMNFIFISSNLKKLVPRFKSLISRNGKFTATETITHLMELV